MSRVSSNDARRSLRLRLDVLSVRQADHPPLVRAHNRSGVRTVDEATVGEAIFPWFDQFHNFPQLPDRCLLWERQQFDLWNETYHTE